MGESVELPIKPLWGRRAPSKLKEVERLARKPALYADMYFVYVIRNMADSGLYVGYTNNLERRLGEHRKMFPKDEMIYYEAYVDEQYARERERRLKYHGSAWRALKKRINA